MTSFFPRATCIAFYKQNYYGYVVLKKTVESTVQIDQLDL